MTNIVSYKNKLKVNEMIGDVESLDGTFQQNKFWDLKKKLLPKNHEPPTSKRDKKGNLINSKDSLMKLYIETYKERLSPATINHHYLDIFQLKSELWKRRNDLMKSTTTAPWEIEDLDKSLKRLKVNKTRDPHGFVNDIFKEGCIGADLKEALLSMFNEMKSSMEVPNIIQWSNITSIYKRSGSKEDMNNQRGIFNLTVLRKIADNLLYNDLH